MIAYAKYARRSGGRSGGNGTRREKHAAGYPPDVHTYLHLAVAPVGNDYRPVWIVVETCLDHALGGVVTAASHSKDKFSASWNLKCPVSRLSISFLIARIPNEGFAMISEGCSLRQRK